jgi:hypothetical protein
VSLEEKIVMVIRKGVVRKVRKGVRAEVRVSVCFRFREVELGHSVVVDHEFFLLRELDF